MKTIRYWKPTRRYVLNTTIPVSVKHWTWIKGKGLYCTYKSSLGTVRSDYRTVREFERAIQEGREHAVEVKSLST